jgi:predicted dehydrogenase
MTGIALVGTGFVSDYYMTTLVNYPDLKLAGAWDWNPDRLRAFGEFYNARTYHSLDELLRASDVDIVVNLTTPESHFSVNKAALEANKHVYCEKPLAMSLDEAETLISMAEERGLTICGAPANALSDAFLLARGLIEKGQVGQPRLVYAEMEDGPVFRANWEQWKSRSGVPWPGADEFEVGVTLEHASYALSWLVGLFGPVVHVSAFSALTFPDKGPGTRHLKLAPDFSVGCLTFRSGVVARITCGLAAPRDRSFTVLGDAGTLVVRDLWDNRSPIDLAAKDQRSIVQKVVERIESRLGRRLPLRLYSGRGVSYPRNTSVAKLPSFPSQIDFVRGIQKQAEALGSDQPPFFSGRVTLHLTELTLALHAGLHDYQVRTSFDSSPQ